MSEQKIKKEEWEGFVKFWSKIKYPIAPGRVSLSRYKKLIKKHVKGKEALLLGPTWQIRDMLAQTGFHVTAVDISGFILKAHTRMCKVRKKKREAHSR